MTPGGHTARGARAAALATLVGCAVLAACGTDQTRKPPKYKLEGSLTEYMNFGFDEVRYESDQTQLALSFIRYRGEDLDGGTPAGEDVPLKLTVRTNDLDPVALETLDFNLADDAGNGGLDQRGVASRNVLNDPRTSFTTIQRGGVKLDVLPTEQGQTTHGSMHITFDPGITFASGRTLYGNFTAVVP